MNYRKYFINCYNKKELQIKTSKGIKLISKKKYYDFISGISINNLGYRNIGIIINSILQILKIIHPSNYFFTKSQVNIAKKLIYNSDFDRIFFANSGTEANEAALAFLTKYIEKTKSFKNEIITFENSFFGRTYGSRILNNGGKLGSFKIIKIPINNYLAFKKSISENTLAIYFELIQGHGGIQSIDELFLKKIYNYCRMHDIKIIIDEVQTALGRTGFLFFYKYFNIFPDIITLGKSLGGGFPLSAVLMRNEIASKIEPGDYGSTMGGNSVACIAGISVINYCLNKKNMMSVIEKGLFLKHELNKIKKKYTFIKEIRGFGLMLGVEIISTKITKDIVNSCLKKGIILDIVKNNVIRLTPPLTIKKKQLNFFINKFEESIKEIK